MKNGRSSAIAKTPRQSEPDPGESMQRSPQTEAPGHLRRVVIVFDLAASEGGALSILQDFYNAALTQPDPTVEWILICGRADFPQTGTVTVRNYGWVKSSWLHRAAFDLLVAPRLVKRLGPDAILSLQNLVVLRTSVPQVLYLHNPLPFSPVRFNPLKHPVLEAYRVLLGPMMVRSARRARFTIVQTNWMRAAVLRRARIQEDRVLVHQPQLAPPPPLPSSEHSSRDPVFLYPASPIAYKNHPLIMNAVSSMVANGVPPFQVDFTFSHDHSFAAGRIARHIARHRLPIRLVGRLDRDEVISQLRSAILLFPSSLETFGLPLLEARAVNATIVAPDLPFAREVLHEYPGVFYFRPGDPASLAQAMASALAANREHGGERANSQRRHEKESPRSTIDLPRLVSQLVFPSAHQQ